MICAYELLHISSSLWHVWRAHTPSLLLVWNIVDAFIVIGHVAAILWPGSKKYIKFTKNFGNASKERDVLLAETPQTAIIRQRLEELAKLEAIESWAPTFAAVRGLPRSLGTLQAIAWTFLGKSWSHLRIELGKALYGNSLLIKKTCWAWLQRLNTSYSYLALPSQETALHFLERFKRIWIWPSMRSR